jgi:AcrR family transcriptional regulator
VTFTPLTRRRRAPRGSGDRLHDEILDAATELLLETGDQKAVSIRSVAQRVGITPPSIYLHFADKDALLDAVCAHYFEKLDQVMQLAAVGQPTTLDVLRAQGLAYVRFATQTPELYRIATMGHGTAGSDVDASLTSAAFTHMRDSVQTLIDQGIYAPGDPTAMALQLWTAAHGVAALLIAKPYFPFGDVDAFTDQVLRAVCCGHIVAGIVGDTASPQQTVEWLLARRDPKEDSDDGR